MGGGTDVLLVENGDILRFDGQGGRVSGRAPVGRVFIDGTRTGEVGSEVLRDRRHLSADGLVVPIVTIRKQDGRLESAPEIITRGVVVDERTDALLREVPDLLREALDAAGLEERTDQGLITERIRVELQRFFRKRVGRRPMVLPVVMEI